MSSNSDTSSAADLVRRITEGDRKAEHEMVMRFQRGLIFMLKRKSNTDIAEEVAQETWRVVIEKVRKGEIRQPEKLAAFIVQTGRNQLIMYFRRNADSGVDDSKVAEMQDESNPHSEAEQTQCLSFVRQILNELKTPRDREILTRFYLREEEKDVICHDLELSDLHFNRVLHRAKQRLRAFVESMQQDAVP